MAYDSELFERVIERLSRMAAPQYRARPITEDTELYRDLGIYGDEIVDLIWWLNKEFGVQTNVDPFAYAPRESPLFGVLRTIRKVLGKEPQYRSLKVRDILSAIEVKRWPDETLKSDAK